MEQEMKERRHIIIPETDEMTFEQIGAIIDEIIRDILKDEPIAFSFINEQGFIVGSEGLLPVQNYVFNDGTLMRIFTMHTRWRISVVRRESRFVTFIELQAPKETSEMMPKAIEYLLKKTKGHLEIPGE
jgi:hypothetical protein